MIALGLTYGKAGGFVSMFLQRADPELWEGGLPEVTGLHMRKNCLAVQSNSEAALPYEGVSSPPQELLWYSRAMVLGESKKRIRPAASFKQRSLESDNLGSILALLLISTRSF